MYNYNSNGSRAAWVRGFAAFLTVLAMGLSLMVRPAEAAPFAYVANNGFASNSVSVIDTATNTVMATVPVGSLPNEVAVTPDGKHAYVTNFSSNNVSVIATATNKVVASAPVGSQPGGVAIIPPPPGVPFLASAPRSS
jgi:YVTN family beta-propeller protein